MEKADCLFCKIIKKEIPSRVIYEDRDSVAILDLNPMVPGHAMVLPRFHAENIIDLPDDLIGGLFKSVKKTTSLLSRALGPDGFTIGINHGKVSGQTVPHLHIHIMPRWHNDNGGSIHSVVNNPVKKTLDEIEKKILEARESKNI